jgi:uncharacterized protein (UPF0264 family)
MTEQVGLLVSVRSAAEAEAAVRGGASLIDVKEPLNGPLGKADDTVIAGVIECVAGRRPVSAALGELIDQHPSIPRMRLDFIKWGLSRCSGDSEWQRVLGRLISCRHVGDPRIVVVAYADWRIARAPSVAEVVHFACQWRDIVFMIDTFEKGKDTRSGARRTLLDWLSLDEIRCHCERCRQASIEVAVAGSLTEESIEQLIPARPDWFAVRGAVCGRADRLGRVEEAKVQNLALTLKGRNIPPLALEPSRMGMGGTSHGNPSGGNIHKWSAQAGSPADISRAEPSALDD